MEKTQLDRIESKVDQCLLAIDGDGTESRPGFKLEIDRLKQARSSDNWWKSTIIGAFLTGLGSLVLAWIRAR